ncbi:MAG: hypothetical protein LBB40_03125 [Holophagales bacterium]|nr:hypothetical protein [Holophagales bacterium]
MGDSFAPSADSYARGSGFIQDSYNARADKSGLSNKAGQIGSGAKDKSNSTQSVGEREDTLELSPEAKRMLESLKARDKAVRAHEAAHLAAAGGIAKGGAQFTLQRGPDGNSYAIGGEVSVDTGSVPNNPQATIAKARQIAAAALAPADPSPQDKAVAASARQMETSAAAELAKKSNEQTQTGLTAKGQQATEAYKAYSAGSTGSLQETTDPIARAYQTVA